MILKSLPLFFLVGFSCAVSAADAYRWEDAQGRVYYSDQFPPTGARNVRRTPVGDGASEEPLPYRLQLAVTKSPVTLYVTDCGLPCKKARELLIERGVPHTLLDASSAKVQEALAELIGAELEVPVLQVGKTVVRGFQAAQWNAALDAAGYPGLAMVKVKPHIPSQDKQSATAASESSESAATEDDTDFVDTESGQSESDESGIEHAKAETTKSDETDVADVEKAQ